MPPPEALPSTPITPALRSFRDVYKRQAENVAHTSSAFSFAQNDIDHVLRLGGNTDRQRERVVAAFEKQKTTAEIAEILKTLYHGGNGLGLSLIHI